MSGWRGRKSGERGAARRDGSEVTQEMKREGIEKTSRKARGMQRGSSSCRQRWHRWRREKRGWDREGPWTLIPAVRAKEYLQPLSRSIPSVLRAEEAAPGRLHGVKIKIFTGKSGFSMSFPTLLLWGQNPEKEQPKKTWKWGRRSLMVWSQPRPCCGAWGLQFNLNDFAFSS